MSDEIEDDTEEILREQLHSLRKLIEGEGWKLLCILVDEQDQVRANQILTMDLQGIESVMEIQRLKSERNGLRLFKVLPETMMEQLEEELTDESSE